MHRSALTVILAMALSLAGAVAWLIRADGNERPAQAADTLRGAMP